MALQYSLHSSGLGNNLHRQLAWILRENLPLILSSGKFITQMIVFGTTRFSTTLTSDIPFPFHSLKGWLSLEILRQLYNDHLQNTFCTKCFYRNSGRSSAIWPLRKTLRNMFYRFSSMPRNSENVMFATKRSHLDFDTLRWSIFWLDLETNTLPGS